ncbi:MAG TPA: alpha/beta hydrolase [Actinomycetes bacterium]|jgi:pimeloyl-ACP methyl ester carboxylesterase|nr:alpha/beta hydrolase [Actinomycetes bacterium]
MTVLHHLVEGSGPVVVLLHAGVADLCMWDAQVVALVPGRTVVRCDLPGFGGTPVAPGAGCDAEDVLALLDELGVEGFALVGASYGGFVALQVASAAPDRLDRLVLLDTAADLVEPDESLREVWRREQALVELGDLAGATDLMVEVWLGPDADDHHRALLWDMQRRAFDLQVAAGDDVTSRDLPVDLARITAPVTVVVGDHDLLFFRTTAGALVEGLPHADLVELPWAGHLPSLERPAETARLVATALG